MPAATRNLFAAYSAKGEIDNGGFRQFFWNSTGVLAPEAANGFAAIGMPRTAALLRKAMKAVGEPYLFARDARMTKVGKPFHEEGEAYDNAVFGPMDDEFYALTATEAGGFEKAADAYAAAHAKDTAKEQP